MTEQVEKVQVEDIILTDSMAEAGRKIFAKQLNSMKQHENGSRTGEDIESVHQMRVAIRRMRSLFKLIGDYYKPKVVAKYSRELRDIARALGRIRDADVLILDLEDFRADQDKDSQKVVDSIIKKLDKRRRKDRVKLNEMFDSKSYQKFVDRFKTFTEKSGKGSLPIKSKQSPHQVRHLLPILMYETLANVRAYDTVLEGAEDEVLHELRVEFKQLRYAVEFFSPVLGTSAKNFISEVKNMQDVLGRLNDIAVFTDHVNGIKRLNADQQAIIEQYVDTRNHELEQLREDFDVQWQSFNQRTTQRQLADALLVLR